jgi:hypothetical protein
LKIDQIDGGIPPIDLKILKMGSFTLYKGKNSPYVAPKRFNSKNNGKISVYFTSKLSIQAGSNLSSQSLQRQYGFFRLANLDR